MRLRRSAYLISRHTAADVLDGEGTVILSGHPQTPATWQDSAIDAGWTAHVHPSGVVLHALRLGVDLWLVVQREPAGRGALDDLAAAGSNVYGASLKDTWIAARASTGPARAIMRRWPDWLVSGFIERDGGPVAIRRVVRIAPRDSGMVLPASAFSSSGPWHLAADGSEVPHGDPAERLHVTAWHRPGLLQAIAGYADETPEDGTPEA